MVEKGQRIDRLYAVIAITSDGTESFIVSDKNNPAQSLMIAYDRATLEKVFPSVASAAERENVKVELREFIALQGAH